MDEILSNLSGFGNVLSILVTAAVTWAGSFLFYKQRRDGLDIENESKQSDEWRKLYLESQEDSRKKDDKIDELRKEMGELRRQMFSLERKVQLNIIYRCDKLDCPMRQQTACSTENIEQKD